METRPELSITKSDFKLYLDAPRHLWAKAHGMASSTISDFEQHLSNQGMLVEALAREYIESLILPQNPNLELLWQQTYLDGPFEARPDAILFNRQTQQYTLYEIKSTTKLDAADEDDLCFQAAILQNQMQFSHYYILHLNKDYCRGAALNLAELFTVADLTETVQARLPEMLQLRQDALAAANEPSFDNLGHCLAPNSCPCPAICHPNLPEFSIYDIPYLQKKRKLELLEAGVHAAKDIPAGFKLNATQQRVAAMARTDLKQISPAQIAAELASFNFPLYFLDYETCSVAVPRYEGYKPHQHVIFQFSVHKLESPVSEPEHFEFLSLDDQSPAELLLDALSKAIGETGTILTWNKSFEMSRNSEMAALQPHYAEYLNSLNSRIYDLGDFIKNGHYLHPGFKGSWSLKKVLPAMVPELSYEGMDIGEGGQASLAWWKIVSGEVSQEEQGQLAEALLRYCELDTLATVEIYRRLFQMQN